MSQKQFLLTLSVAVISGSLGGLLSVWFLMPPSVLAQDEPQKLIVAEGFMVVDEEGQTRAVLGIVGDIAGLQFSDQNGKTRIFLSVEDEPSLQLYDENQTPRVALGTTQLKHPDTGSTEIRAPSSLVLFDEEGKVVWSAP